MTQAAIFEGYAADAAELVPRFEALHVKLLQAVPPGGLRLISKNPAYEPVEVAMSDVDVVGRVVWKGGRL